MRKKRPGGVGKTLVIAAALAITALSTHARAAIITFDFEAVLSRPFGTLSSGHVLTGSYTFDESLPDGNGFSQVGVYSFAGFSITDGTETASTTDMTIAVFDDNPSVPFRDHYDLAGLLSGSLGGVAISTARLRLFDFDAPFSPFSSDELPTTPDFFNNPDWDSKVLYLNSTSTAGTWTALSLAAVPEPSTLAMLLPGLLGVLVKHFQRKKPDT